MFFVLQKTRRCSTWEVSCAASSARWWWAAGWTPGVRARAPALDRPPGGPAQPTGARACSSWSVGLRPAASELLLHKIPFAFSAADQWARHWISIARPLIRSGAGLFSKSMCRINATRTGHGCASREPHAHACLPTAWSLLFTPENSFVKCYYLILFYLLSTNLKIS
jgi:hypothetical protein